MEDNMLEFIKDLQMINPDLIYIEKYKPKERTEGGIIIPQERQEREQKSQTWGKILRINEGECFEESTNILKSKLKVGMYVAFQAGHPIQGPTNKFKNLQRLGVNDVMDAMDEENFKKWEEQHYFNAGR